MNFVMVRSDGVMSVDNETEVVDLTTLASNIEIAAFNTVTAIGNLEYNDRPRLLEPFADPTPYQPQLNAWITAVAARPALPLSLAQSKVVKNGLIDGIYNFKRQQPILAFSLLWDATDSALAAMISALETWDIVGAINSAFASVANEVNSMGITTTTITTVTSTITSMFEATGVTGSDPQGGTITSVPPLGPSGSQVILLARDPGIGGVGVSSSASSPSYSSHTNINVQVLPAPAIAWPPYNSTTTVSLDFSQMRALITAIGVRSISYRNTQLTKKAAVNALASIAAVVTYDVTTGWPA
jgi:hypothetical protein